MLYTLLDHGVWLVLLLISLSVNIFDFGRTKQKGKKQFVEGFEPETSE